MLFILFIQEEKLVLIMVFQQFLLFSLLPAVKIQIPFYQISNNLITIGFIRITAKLLDFSTS